MRTRYLLAAVVAGLATATASAQTGGTTGSTGSSGGGISGLSNSTSTGTTLQQQQSAPSINGAGVTTSSAVSPTNALAGYYASPQYPGRAGATGNDPPGGFGVALSGTGTTSSGRATGTAFSSGTSRSTGSTGTSSTAGRTTTGVSTSLSGGTTQSGLTGVSSLGGTTRTGTTGFGTTNRTTGLGSTGFGTSGLGSTSSQGAAIIALPRQITYTATLRMPMPVINVPQQTTELRGMLDRSSMIANPRGIQLETNGPVVILRGTVKDEDEAKTAEGIVRLTPGVKDVKNELKY